MNTDHWADSLRYALGIDIARPGTKSFSVWRYEIWNAGDVIEPVKVVDRTNEPEQSPAIAGPVEPRHGECSTTGGL